MIEENDILENDKPMTLPERKILYNKIKAVLGISEIKRIADLHGVHTQAGVRAAFSDYRKYGNSLVNALVKEALKVVYRHHRVDAIDINKLYHRKQKQA